MRNTIVKILFSFCLLFASLTTRAGYEFCSINVSEEKGLTSNEVSRVFQDEHGYINIQDRRGQYVRFDGYSFHSLSSQEAKKLVLPHNTVSPDGKKYLDEEGNPYLVTPQGDFVFTDKRTGEEICFPLLNQKVKQLTNAMRICVVFDRRGLFWVSVNGNGIFVYDRAKHGLRHFAQGSPGTIVRSDYIVDMCKDDKGNIWISQLHFGISCIQVIPKKYTVVYPCATQSEKKREIRLLQRLADGSILVADKDGNLYLSHDQLQSFTPQVSDGEIYISMGYDGQHRLWLGSRKNGLRIDGKHYSRSRIDCIVRDRKNRMWICGINGKFSATFLSDGGIFHEQPIPLFSDNLQPRVLFLDHRGMMWLGGETGLYVFNPDQLITSPKAFMKRLDVPVRSIFEDNSHHLWIGSDGKGVYHADNHASIAKTFAHIGAADGLANGVVQFIKQDTRGHLCFGTEDGCYYYHVKDQSIFPLRFPKERLRNFYNERCAVLLPDGRMAFGTLDGIVVADKDVADGNATTRQLAITGLDIHGTPVYELGEKAPFPDDVCMHDKVSLDHTQNTLTISFSNFDYLNTSSTLYSYRLEGFEEGWSQPSSLNFASYKELPPGTYTFHVRSRSANGKWNKDVKTLTIEILPPFYATWWAYASYLAVLCVIAVFIYRQVRYMAQLKQNVIIEKRLTAYKLRFFTNISHEFRTPLTLIKGAMERMEDTREIPASMKQPVSSMRHSVERMMRLIDQLLEFRRLQNNKLSLSLQKTDVVQFLYGIFLNFHDVSANKNIGYQFLPSRKSIVLFVDQGYIDKIVYNLLSNAFRYTPNGGSITLSVREQGECLEIIVKDTGIGISKEKRKVLFERYATGKVKADSIGIGLNLTHELVLRHHGEITYDDNPGGGSVFKVTLPLDESVYENSDFMRETPAISDAAKSNQSFIIPYQEPQREPMNGKTVLVVEDNMDLSEMLRTELGKYFQVMTAYDGKEGYELLQTHPEEIDLLVSDVMMPAMNGFELTKKIRSNPSLRHLPVILLTALTAEEKQERGLDIGADAYIPKPFSIKVLVAQCCNLIHQREILKAIYAQQKSAPERPAAIIKDELDRKFLASLDQLIDMHLADEDFSLNKLAELLHLGRTTFFNRVHTLTGLTPNEYIREKRMSKAVELLEAGELNISEISMQVGFSMLASFSSAFKTKYGVSPREYRKGM